MFCWKNYISVMTPSWMFTTPPSLAYLELWTALIKNASLSVLFRLTGCKLWSVFQRKQSEQIKQEHVCVSDWVTLIYTSAEWCKQQNNGKDTVKTNRNNSLITSHPCYHVYTIMYHQFLVIFILPMPSDIYVHHMQIEESNKWTLVKIYTAANILQLSNTVPTRYQ